MKKGDIFEVNGGWALYMGDKIYIAHQVDPLLELEVRLGRWTIYIQPLSLSSESELRRKKALCNIGRKMLLRLDRALHGELQYCGPCLAEAGTFESAALYDAQMERLNNFWARLKRLQWRT